MPMIILYKLKVKRNKLFPGGSVVKNLPAKQKTQFAPWVGKIPWRRKWQPIPVFLLGKSYGQRSLEGDCLLGCKRVKTQLSL